MAKVSYIKGLIEDGWEVEVPKKFKWKADHEKMKRDKNGYDWSKLNNSNVGVLHMELEKLYKPKPQIKNGGGALTERYGKKVSLFDIEEASDISDIITENMS